MAEGRFWVCTWERSGDGYAIWVSNRPSLRGTGAAWQDSLDSLSGAIGLASGDGEPRFSFDPPEPQGPRDETWMCAEWVTVSAEGSMPLADFTPDLFESGCCEHCQRPMGKRTGVPLRATGAAEGDVCGPWFYISWSKYSPFLLSERARGLLTPAEQGAADWIPVTPAPRTRKRFYECIPHQYVARVSVRGWTTNGSRCPLCNRISWLICTSDEKVDFGSPQCHDWARQEDIAGPCLPLRGLGEPDRFNLVFSSERARALVQQNEWRGSRSGTFGAVPSQMADPSPLLPATRKE